MDFEEALSNLKTGWQVTNEEWNGKDMYLNVQVPDIHSKMTHPYIYMVNAKGQYVPWAPSQIDLFSMGWKTV